ncbi:MAG: hypothetical protein AAGB04_00150 [Pseudomonadota bacterium]
MGDSFGGQRGPGISGSATDPDWFIGRFVSSDANSDVAQVHVEHHLSSYEAKRLLSMLQRGYGGLPESSRGGDSDRVPLECVRIAGEFVSRCNDVMYSNEAKKTGHDTMIVRRIEHELPVSQDGAFRLACRVLGKYFSESGRLKEEETNQPGAD